jgi:hypothetical protein
MNGGLKRISSMISRPKLFINAHSSPNIRDWLLFLIILGIGIFSRTWESTGLPPGLNQDEASIGVDAYDVYKFGMDRNGVTYPITFTAFGQEQNAIYGYILIPFIAVLGLTTHVVRLPMLISGILTIPLVFFIATRVLDKRLGFLSMFFVAISPWHILLSRWGSDINFFPFVFILGFASLVEASRDNRFFVIACIFFALCFYSYGISYFIVPFFLLNAVLALLRGNMIDRRSLILGLSLFGLLAVPISLFILINTFSLTAIHLGPVTIPRLPSQPRFLTDSGVLHSQIIPVLSGNLWTLLKLLILQNDGLIYNTFEPYGYFYKVTFPLAIIGLLLLLQSQKVRFDPRVSLVISWLVSCLIFGILEQVNVNRINIIFIPLIICIAVGVDWLARNINTLFWIAVCGLLIAFTSFTIDYHGERYRALADVKFHTGFLSAMQFADKTATGPICVTDKINNPYIYMLFLEKPDPRSYLGSIKYLDTPGPFKQVGSLGRYTFGKQNCLVDPATVYVLASEDGRPHTSLTYHVEVFDQFYVYYPKP